MRSALPAALLLSMTGCATLSSAPVVNPVIDADFPDPAVLRAPDGYVYAYATQGNGANIQVARSRDLRGWQRIGDALPVKPAWASRTQDFWAPHVAYADGRYFLYYSAKPDAALEDTSRGLCLAVATATRPEGPFTDIGRPLECGQGFANIDPFTLDDPATGARLYYWGSGFGPIKVRELAPDRISFAPGSTERALIYPCAADGRAGPRPCTGPSDYERLVEGAWVVRREGWYYMFYSGDNCCGPRANYAVLVARSRSATGPFETRPAAEGGTVVLERGGRWLAPGHVSVIADAAGRDWLVYHAVDTTRPRNRESDEINTRRPMLIAPIRWRAGWPGVAAPR